ncbi:MAG: hypothetical protein FWH20_06295 [Oscillospiraceae bacterium]|nr:hypothetical protein [Oscillospiraceae bacterium]
MRKFVLLVIIAGFVSIFAACTKQGGEIETGEFTEVGEPESPENEPVNEKYFLPTKYGDYIDMRQADRIESASGAPLTLDEILNDDVFFMAWFDNFTYVTKPRSLSLNSIDNVFDDEKNTFDTEIPRHDYEFFRVSIGDTFEGLVVDEALVIFYSNEGILRVHSSRVSYSGTHTVSGFITVGHHFHENDILFFADAETGGDVPINNEMFWQSEQNNFKYISDLKMFYLGQIEEYENIDIAAIPQDGSLARVSVTLSNIEMSNFDSDSGRVIRAEIVSVGLLDEREQDPEIEAEPQETEHEQLKKDAINFAIEFLTAFNNFDEEKMKTLMTEEYFESIMWHKENEPPDDYYETDDFFWSVWETLKLVGKVGGLENWSPDAFPVGINFYFYDFSEGGKTDIWFDHAYVPGEIDSTKRTVAVTLVYNSGEFLVCNFSNTYT